MKLAHLLGQQKEEKVDFEYGRQIGTMFLPMNHCQHIGAGSEKFCGYRIWWILNGVGGTANSKSWCACCRQTNEDLPTLADKVNSELNFASTVSISTLLPIPPLRHRQKDILHFLMLQKHLRWTWHVNGNGMFSVFTAKGEKKSTTDRWQLAEGMSESWNVVERAVYRHNPNLPCTRHLNKPVFIPEFSSHEHANQSPM